MLYNEDKIVQRPIIIANIKNMRRNVMGRGEDTTTYGDATPWLQPGTPLGDLLIEILTGRPPKKKSDEEDGEDDKD